MVKNNHKLSSNKSEIDYPPVVAVLGHVDHGKTTLLDAIRKTDIASKEHGGITQGIGATSIEFLAEGVRRRITFIDTPGHEAFMQMRGRGTQAADIGILVVSSTDGVMPQTKESIKLLKEAKLTFIVALTKSDLPDKNEERVKQQLLKEEVMLEGYGGDVPYLPVSARANTNIKELLELIRLVFEMERQKNVSPRGDLKGIVIESRLDHKTGSRATVVVKNGTLSVRDEIVCEGVPARVRAIINDKGQHLKSAGIGDAIEIIGFEKVPKVGGIVTSSKLKVKSSKLEKTLPPVTPAPAFRSGQEAMSMPEDFLNQKEEPTLSIVLCADNEGSLEAILKSIPQEINVALKKTGDISPADILFAKSIGAIVLGFNIKIKPEIMKFALQEKVLAKSYKIIYELIDEVKDVLEGKQLALVEEIYGRAKVLASFPFEKTKVLGVKILEGRVARGDKIRVIRKDEIIGESTVTSVRIGKNPISKVEAGNEAGIIISPLLDFTIGDMLVCHG